MQFFKQTLSREELEIIAENSRYDVFWLIPPCDFTSSLLFFSFCFSFPVENCLRWYLQLFNSLSVTKIAEFINSMKIVEFANSVDLDEVAHHEPPHLDLHCLPSSL